MSSSPAHPTVSGASKVGLADAYLTLCKHHLTRGTFARAELPRGHPLAFLEAPVRRVLDRLGFDLVRPLKSTDRSEGLKPSSDAETMIGMKRLDNLQDCVTTVLRDEVPGDLIETGVWRGGASIFMRAVLLAHGDVSRTVWVADSFQGLPKPDPGRYPADRGDRLWQEPSLAVSLDTVKANFTHYGLLDDQVRFLQGWFSETLPTAPIEKLAILRLDGDMYESTTDALTALYPKLSVGGYVIIDDYGAIAGCRQAVADYRAKHGIVEEIARIDWTGAFWRRSTKPQ